MQQVGLGDDDYDISDVGGQGDASAKRPANHMSNTFCASPVLHALCTTLLPALQRA